MLRTLLRGYDTDYLVTKSADKSTSVDPTGTAASTAVALARAVLLLLVPCLCTVSCSGWTCRAWARDSSAVTWINRWASQHGRRG